MPCVRWASSEGIVRAAKMEQEFRTDRNASSRLSTEQSGANDSTRNGKEALKDVRTKTPA
jgi:hypothetical protein